MPEPGPPTAIACDGLLTATTGPASGRASLALGALLRAPLGLFGAVLVALVVASALGADLLASHDPYAMNFRIRLAPPGWDHLLGTDNLGRDVLARVLHGGRIALEVGLSAVSASLIMGLALGMIAGYGPAALDRPLMLLFDAVRSFPTVLFALAVVTLIGPSLWTIILVVVVTSTPVYARIVRTQTLSLKAQEFILIERALGAGPTRILAVHVLPNLIGPLMILASMDIPVVITLEAGLSFLGLGVRPPSPSWGSILNDGYTFIRDTPWLVIAGGLPLIVTTLGFTFLGEALRDAFDPRLRGA
jgi:peptide/nickel transport system permease protein